MAKQDILAKVISLVVEQLNVEVSMVAPDSRFVESLGADSLDLFEMTAKLEEHYGIKIPDEEAETLGSVGDVVEYLVPRIR